MSALKEFKNKLFPMAVHLAIPGTSTQKPEACKQGTENTRKVFGLRHVHTIEEMKVHGLSIVSCAFLEVQEDLRILLTLGPSTRGLRIEDIRVQGSGIVSGDFLQCT